MPWQAPAKYEPMDNLGGYLRGLSPKMDTSELDMVIYWQWTHATLPKWRKTPGDAWAHLNMTPANARDAIDKKIVPMEIYDLVLQRAEE